MANRANFRREKQSQQKSANFYSDGECPP
jgi:hypothetical protein